jgi:SAM-dependent methyltransferase
MVDYGVGDVKSMVDQDVGDVGSIVDPDVKDVGSIEKNVNELASPKKSEAESSEKVREYYEQTTDRDYQWLECVMGAGMHTKLEHTTQEMLVLNEIHAHGDVSDVLEVGCGRGSCSLYLAEVLKGKVAFTGVDLVGRHVEVAKADCALRGLDGIVDFVQGDLSGDWKEWEMLTTAKKKKKYQVIFGVESLCHMDSKEKVGSFMRQAARRLSTGGRLVIVDGFRCRMWEKAGVDHKMAMRLAEGGFKIRRMPTKADWIRAGGDEDMAFVSSVDLTGDALPYWTFGWRVARFVLCCGEWIADSSSFIWAVGSFYGAVDGLSRLLGGVVAASGADASGIRRQRGEWAFGRSVMDAIGSPAARRQTAGNVIAAATVAHAMRGGASEYGVLVLEKMKHREHGDKEKARLRYAKMCIGNKSI